MATNNKGLQAINKKRSTKISNRPTINKKRITNLQSRKPVLGQNQNLNNTCNVTLRSNFTKLRSGKLAGFRPVIDFASTNKTNIIKTKSIDNQSISIGNSKSRKRKYEAIKKPPQTSKSNSQKHSNHSEARVKRNTSDNEKKWHHEKMIMSKELKALRKTVRLMKATSANQKRTKKTLNSKLKQTKKYCNTLSKENKYLQKLVSSISKQKFTLSVLLDLISTKLQSAKIKISAIDFKKTKAVLTTIIELFNNNKKKNCNKNTQNKKKKVPKESSKKRKKRLNINVIEKHITNICKTNGYNEFEMYKTLSGRHVKNFQPKFTYNRAMKFMRDCTIQQNKLDKVQHGLRELFGYPVFPRHGIVTSLLKDMNLSTADIFLLIMDRAKRSKQYRAGNRTVESNVYIVKDITEAVCLSIKKNIDLNIHEIPASFPQDKINWKFHGDEGGGLTHLSVTPLTRKYPNSTQNSTVVVCWRKPAVLTYDNLAQVIDTEIMTALMNRPKINIITLTNGAQIKSHISFLVLDTWGQSRLNILQEEQHMNNRPTIEPNNTILKLKYYFDRENNAAHYHTGNLQIVSTKSFLNVSLDKDWDLFCTFKKKDDSDDRYICISKDVLPNNFSNWIAIENDGYIIGGLRVRISNKETMEAGEELEQLEIFGRGRFYPKVPLKNIDNLIFKNDDTFYIQYGNDEILHCNEQATPTKKLKIHWTSKDSAINLTGDLDFLCKMIGHNGSACTYPSLLCDILMASIHSKENCKQSIQKGCEYRTFKSVMENWCNFQKNKNLKLSHGIGKQPLVPLYVWCFSDPTLHLMEGPMAVILLCFDSGLKLQLNLNKEEKQLKNIANLQEDKMKLVKQLLQHEQTEKMLDYGYDTFDIEMSTGINIEKITLKIGEIEDEIQKQTDLLQPNNPYRLIHEFRMKNKMCEHNYMPKSVKGITIKNNLKHYDTLSELTLPLDKELALHYNDMMSHFEVIYDMVCRQGDRIVNERRKKNKLPKLYGEKLSEDDVKNFETSIEEFIPLYYSFIDKFGPKSNENNDSIASGVKVHYFEHLPAKIRSKNNTRIAFFNEEITEHQVQQGKRIFGDYSHMYGKRQMKCGMRAWNMHSLCDVLCEPPWITDFTAD
eukprot:35219_1